MEGPLEPPDIISHLRNFGFDKEAIYAAIRLLIRRGLVQLNDK